MSVLLGVLGADKTTLCVKTIIYPHIPESHQVSGMDWELFLFVVGFSHQRTLQIEHHFVSLRTGLGGLSFGNLAKFRKGQEMISSSMCLKSNMSLSLLFHYISIADGWK